MKIITYILLFPLINALQLIKTNMEVANKLNYKYLRIGSNLNYKGKKINSPLMKELAKSIVYTRNIKINESIKDDFYILYNVEQTQNDLGLCITETIDNTLYIKCITVNPFLNENYSSIVNKLIDLFIHKFNENEISLKHLPDFLKFEILLNDKINKKLNFN